MREWIAAKTAAFQMGTRARPLLLFAAVGAAAGLLAFAVETIFVIRAAHAMIDFDATGTARDAFAATRPALLSVLVRIAVLYGVAGAFVSVVSASLASDAARTRSGFRVLWAIDAIVLCLLAAWAACIARPALFEDVDALRPLLRWTTHSARPWHVLTALTVFCALHLRRSAQPRRLLRATMFIGGFSAAGVATHAIPASRQAALVLLIGIDAFRPDRVEGEALERHLAPHLERFFQDAVRFDRAYTPIAQTEPAWAALLSGDWPWKTRVRHPLTPDSRRARLPTLASSFGAAGFHTVFTTDCSRFHWEPPDSGFEERLQPPRGALNFVLEKLRYRLVGVFAANTLGSWWLPEMADNRALAGFYDPFGYARRLAARIVREASSRPTLFAFHATAVHYPGDAVYPFYRRFPDAPLRMTYALAGDPANAAGVEPREQLYDELISEADEQIGVLLDALREQGLYDSAWIVVFSDHGEGFQPGFAELARSVPVHGARLSEDENRILLAFKPPKGSGIETGRTVHDLVRLIDIAPTLLEAEGVASPAPSDGVSLLPRMRGVPQSPLFLYAETGYTHVPPDAFDPAHFSGGARGFDAYRVRSDGAIEMTEEAHAIAMREKDRGAYDGRGWIIDWRSADGGRKTRCEGECSAELATWFAELRRSHRRATTSQPSMQAPGDGGPQSSASPSAAR